MTKKRRIIIITQGLSRIVQPIFDTDFIDVVGIIEGAPRQRKVSNTQKIIKQYHRLRGTGLEKNELLIFSENKQVPYFYMENSSDELANWVEGLKPDIIVVYIMSQLLKEKIYNIPKYGSINLHPSFLPKYRGPNPCFWTYYNMEEKGGVTVHFIDNGEDTGAIIAQKEYSIPLGIKSPERFDLAISKIGVELLLFAIKNIDNIIPQEQPKESITSRARNLKKSEHKEIIEFKKWPIQRIWHVLRGTELWLEALPNPPLFNLGSKWKIEEYEVIKRRENWEYDKVHFENGRYFIICNQGRIFLSISKNYKSLLIFLIEKILR
jgi:methionyl-tRNA formyltransferase